MDSVLLGLQVTRPTVCSFQNGAEVPVEKLSSLEWAIHNDIQASVVCK